MKNFFINPIHNDKIGYDIYKFFLFNKKFYELNNSKREGDLIIYNGYFPFDGLHNYCKEKKYDKIEFLESEVSKFYKLNKKFLKNTKNILFFYPYSYFDKDEYDVDLIKILDEKIFERFGKRAKFVLNNFKYSEEQNYANFNGFSFDCYNESFSNFYKTEERNPNKIFICLNNKKRSHRNDLLNFIVEKNIMNHFHYSYIEEKINLHESGTLNSFFDDYYRNKKIHYSGHRSYRKVLNDDLWTIDHRNFFDDSFYYLITETNIKNDVLFLSEKTYKAFYHRIPFMIIGNPGSLKLLRDEGFKTFDKYIDESYDNEDDYQKRIQKIHSEILRLISISKDEHIKIIKDMESTLEHNWIHYYDNYDQRFLKAFGRFL